VSQYQKSKTNLDFNEETLSASGISRTIRKSAPRSRHITMPTAHHQLLPNQQQKFLGDATP